MQKPEPYLSALSRSLREFLQVESAGGVVMITFAFLGLAAANSPFSALYQQVINAPISLGIAPHIAVEPLKDWVKDILMVLFFLVIGLELKKEMSEGFLSEAKQIGLPLVAAFGGMTVPALIFLSFNHGIDTAHGWAIPSATDIAFALAVLTLLGRNIPPAIKIFLLAVAVFDDLGAIIIIAAFYNTGIALAPLGLAALGLLALALLNRLRVAAVAPYFLTGVFLWFCFHFAGIHTTLAGVIVGLMIPMRHPRDPDRSPVKTCTHFLHPWVNFVVLPIFAFTSAGLELGGLRLSNLAMPLPLGIILGLLLGKQIGVFGTSWILIRLKLVNMPVGATWRHLYAVSVVAGIGFTMSLFIGMLAFPDPAHQEMVKLGVIGGSALCVGWSAIVLRLAAQPLPG